MEVWTTHAPAALPLKINVVPTAGIRALDRPTRSLIDTETQTISYITIVQEG